MPHQPMTAEDKRWQAESDARTLADANVIKGDKPRTNRAKAAAKRMASEQQKQATAMKRVAAKRVPAKRK